MTEPTRRPSAYHLSQFEKRTFLPSTNLTKEHLCGVCIVEINSPLDLTQVTDRSNFEAFLGRCNCENCSIDGGLIALNDCCIPTLPNTEIAHNAYMTILKLFPHYLQ